MFSIRIIILPHPENGNPPLAFSGDMPANSCQKCVRCALTAGHHRDKINKVPGVACEKGAGKEKTEMRE
jgi:hypothetical protein